MATMQQNRMHIAVLCLDVDRFHEMNDSVDLATGDAVLREVGNRIRAALRTGDFVARHSSDEFAVAVVDIDNLGEVVSFMDRLAEALRLPISIADKEFMCTMSAGIALARNDGDTAPKLLRHADIALARAKAEGDQRMRFFEESMDKALQRRRTVAQDLRLALRREEFEVVCQSQFDLATARADRRRSFGPLASSGAWQSGPDPLHLGGGGNRLDRAARRMGAPPRLQRRRHL